MPLLRLFSVWQKERDHLEEKHGQEFGFDYMGEFVAVQKNPVGRRRHVYLDNLNLRWTVDLAKAGWARDGTIHLHLIGNSGGDVTGEHLDPGGIGRVGDLQVMSNIEANDTFRVFQFWYEKPFRWGTILLGLDDLNGEFNCSEYGALFSNSSFGIGPDMTMNAPLSIFNVTSPAIRFQYKFFDRLMLQAAIFDGDPGDPDVNRTGLQTRITHKEGFFHIFELKLDEPLGWKDHPGSMRGGRWHHTGRFDDLMNVDAAGDPLRRRHNWGGYVVADQKLFNERRDPEQGLGVFVQAGGLTPRDRSLVERYVGAGFNYTGLVPGRPKDIFGVAVCKADTSGDLREFTIAGGGTGLTAERVFEIDYQVQVNDWLTVKPSWQIVRNVGADPSKDEARIFGLRVTSVF